MIALSVCAAIKGVGAWYIVVVSFHKNPLSQISTGLTTVADTAKSGRGRAISQTLSKLREYEVAIEKTGDSDDIKIRYALDSSSK